MRIKITSQNIFIFTFFLFIGLKKTLAQELRITGDTIFVNTELESQVLFPGNVELAKLAPDDAASLYKLRIGSTNITLKSTSENSKQAILRITEGEKKKKRDHTFIVIYKRKITPENINEYIFDYSTKKKLEEHVAFVAARKAAQPVVVKAAQPIATPKKSKAEEKQEKIDKQNAEKSNKYSNIITEADNALANKDFSNAKKLYNKAIELKPSEVYPKNKIYQIDAEIEGSKKEKTQTLNVDNNIKDKYKDALQRGKAAWKAKDYITAKSAYQEAKNLKPDEKEPNEKLVEIEKKLAAQPKENPVVANNTNNDFISITKLLIKEKPRLDLTAKEKYVRLQCQSINFIGGFTYFKMYIQNYDSKDFKIDDLSLKKIKKKNEIITMSPDYVSPINANIIPAVGGTIVIFTVKDFEMKNDDKLVFTFTGNPNNVHLELPISSAIYFKEKKN